MKNLMTIVFGACAFISSISVASVRETGGAAYFEATLRQTALGSTVLPAVESTLIEQGFVRQTGRNLNPVWSNNGQAFQAKIVYKSSSANLVIQVILTGSLKQSLDLKSIQIIK